MDPPAFHVDFPQVERIDVGKEPLDVRNQGCLGGVVNIVTRRPEEGWHATATAVFGCVASAEQTHVDRSLGESPTPSYALASLTAGWRRGALSITAGVANLFNRYFVEHLSYQRDPFRSGLRVAEPGRNVFSSASWKF